VRLFDNLERLEAVLTDRQAGPPLVAEAEACLAG